MPKPTKNQDPNQPNRKKYDLNREIRLFLRADDDRGFNVPSSTESRSSEYYKALDTSFELNSIIKPSDEWALAPDITESISLEGLTPDEIATIYRELGGLGLSEINEQLILKKAITEQVRWWKQEIRDRIDERHRAFYCKEMRLSTLGYVNSFVFTAFLRADCIYRNQTDKGQVLMNVIQHKIPRLAEIAEGNMLHSTTHTEKYVKNFYPGAFFSSKVLLRSRDYLAAQGCFNFEKRTFTLSTKDNPQPFQPMYYYNVDIPKLLTFAMALEQIILEIDIEDLEDESDLQDKYLPKIAFDRALPKHKLNFLREAFNTLFEAIAQWGRVSDPFRLDDWMPFVDVGIGLTQIEELIWAKFCRTFDWGFRLKPKPS